MLWKLIIAILANLTLVITVLRWDEKLLGFKRGRYSLFIILGILCMGGTVAVYFDATESQKESQLLSQKLEALNSGQKKAAQHAETRNQSQEREIHKLQSMLEPFLVAARNHSPRSDDTTALRSLANRIEQLESSSMDRTVSVESKAKMVSILSAVKGGKVEFRVMAGDTESRRYAERLRQCFTEAGWSAHEPILVFDKVFPQGLHMVVQKKSDSLQQRALEAALLATGQSVKGAFNKSLALGDLRVVVGPK